MQYKGYEILGIANVASVSFIDSEGNYVENLDYYGDKYDIEKFAFAEKANFFDLTKCEQVFDSIEDVKEFIDNI
jgi:hypothetical protein